MKSLKRVLATLIAVLFTAGACVSIAYAEENNKYSLSNQLDGLFAKVADTTNMEKEHVAVLYKYFIGGVLYGDRLPDIYSDEVVRYKNSEKISTIKLITAGFAECNDESIERPNEYYLPDALYSIAATVSKLIEQREGTDRGAMNSYFSAISEKEAKEIMFCEALINYIGNNSASNFFTLYYNMRMNKGADENVIELVNGELTIKGKFKESLIINGIDDEETLDIIALAISYNKVLSCSADATKSDNLPYTLGVMSRANLLRASLALVGKVRYVRGGGHGSAGGVRGINPAWVVFHDAYPSTVGEVGYGMCIKPYDAWCPIHGFSYGEVGCRYQGGKTGSTEEYIESREEALGTDIEYDEAFFDMMEEFTNLDTSGVNIHQLDGMDCSGYVSWVYNQVDLNKRYDSAAKQWNRMANFKAVLLGQKILPGDTLSWSTHITMVVGELREGSGVYILVEQAPYHVKLATAYTSAATAEDKELALKIAVEANVIFGSINETDRVNQFNLQKLGYGAMSPGNVDWDGITYAEVGRYQGQFMDDELLINVGSGNKSIQNMGAQEILQHIIDTIDLEYLTGIKKYQGTIFDISGRL